MTATHRLATAVGSGGNYIARSYNTSRSDGEYERSPIDYIHSFYAVLQRWQSETALLSDPDKITSHPSFAALVHMAELVAPLIIECLRSEPSFLVWVLDDAFGERPYAEADTGNIEAMTNAWIAWAERNGHRF